MSYELSVEQRIVIVDELLKLNWMFKDSAYIQGAYAGALLG
jgi:hypothetical protein